MNPSICLSSCLRVRFFCYRDLRFYQNDAATAAVQIKEEEKNRNAEQKRRGTTLTKVVSSLSPSPTHQGLQHWRRAMQPVVVLHAATTRTTLTKVSTISNSPTSPALASSYAASSCEQVGRICGELEGVVVKDRGIVRVGVTNSHEWPPHGPPRAPLAPTWGLVGGHRAPQPP